jgi:dihydropteroate synthase
MPDRIVPLIHAKKTQRKDVILDPAGFFIIEVKRETEIRVEYYLNAYKNERIVSGILKMIFVGTKADSLGDSIATSVSGLRNEHYIYLGRELQKAQRALENNEVYEQGGC